MPISTKQEALEELQHVLQTQSVVLGWAEKPITFEELIRARLGDDYLNKIYEIIGRG
ncbi:hypothetical protein [Kosakonia phage Kc304]|nr:hypothetical protein [Kosakonia phage Kc304]